MIVTMLPVVAFASANRHASLFEANKTSVEADGKSTVKFTVYTMDSSNVPVPSVVYFASSREDSEVFYDEDDNKLAPATTDNEHAVYYVTTSDDDGKAEFKVSSSVAGKATIGIGLNPEVADYLVGEDVSASAAGLIGTQVIEFTSAKASNVDIVRVKPKNATAVTNSEELNKAEDKEHAITGAIANGLDYFEVTFRVTTAGRARVKSETISFSTDKSAATLNKSSAETNALGEAKVRVYADKPGTYKLTGKVGKQTDTIYLKFGAGDLFNLSVEKGDGAVVALDSEHEIKIKLLDVNGAKYPAGECVDDNNRALTDEDIEVEVITEPDDSDIEDELEYSADSDGLLVITTPELEEEGKYTIQVSLQNGKYVRVSFEVKEQGEIVALELSYPQSAVALGAKVGAPTIKRVDADGVAKKLLSAEVLSDIRFVASDVRMIEDGKINANGTFTATDDDKRAGVLTITAIDTEENVSASFDITIGVEAVGLVLEPEGKAVTGEAARVWLQLVDANGNKIAFGETEDLIDVDVFVLGKPSGSNVSVDVSGDAEDDLKESGRTYLDVECDEDGAVKLQVVVTKITPDDLEDPDDEEITVRFTQAVALNFGKEVVVEKGAEKVVLTIGGTYAYVDGAPVELDAPAFIEEGRTFVPVRFLAEAFGAEADWEPKDAPVETVTLTREDMEIIINIGEEVLTVVKDGEEEVVTFDGAARIVDGRTYLPFRAIAEAFGAEVDYGPQDGPVEWVSFEQ